MLGISVEINVGNEPDDVGERVVGRLETAIFEGSAVEVTVGSIFVDGDNVVGAPVTRLGILDGIAPGVERPDGGSDTGTP
jgi:hypothetical protein